MMDTFCWQIPQTREEILQLIMEFVNHIRRNDKIVRKAKILFKTHRNVLTEGGSHFE